MNQTSEIFNNIFTIWKYDILGRWKRAGTLFIYLSLSWRLLTISGSRHCYKEYQSVVEIKNMNNIKDIEASEDDTVL